MILTSADNTPPKYWRLHRRRNSLLSCWKHVHAYYCRSSLTSRRITNASKRGRAVHQSSQRVPICVSVIRTYTNGSDWELRLILSAHGWASCPVLSWRLYMDLSAQRHFLVFGSSHPPNPLPLCRDHGSVLAVVSDPLLTLFDTL